MLFLFMQYVMGAGCPVDIRLAQTVAFTNSSQKYYHSPLDNGSRFLSCLVYPESGCFTGFLGHQSFCLVL